MARVTTRQGLCVCVCVCECVWVCVYVCDMASFSIEICTLSGFFTQLAQQVRINRIMDVQMMYIMIHDQQRVKNFTKLISISMASIKGSTLTFFLSRNVHSPDIAYS